MAQEQRRLRSATFAACANGSLSPCLHEERQHEGRQLAAPAPNFAKNQIDRRRGGGSSNSSKMLAEWEHRNGIMPQNRSPGRQTIGVGPGFAISPDIHCYAPPRHFWADTPTTQRMDLLADLRPSSAITVVFARGGFADLAGGDGTTFFEQQLSFLATLQLLSRFLLTESSASCAERQHEGLVSRFDPPRGAGFRCSEQRGLATVSSGRAQDGFTLPQPFPRHFVSEPQQQTACPHAEAPFHHTPV